MLCEWYEVTAISLTIMFRMTMGSRALILFDSHFDIDSHNWERVDAVFKNGYVSVTKQEEVSYELATLKLAEFQKDPNR